MNNPSIKAFEVDNGAWNGAGDLVGPTLSYNIREGRRWRQEWEEGGVFIVTEVDTDSSFHAYESDEQLPRTYGASENSELCKLVCFEHASGYVSASEDRFLVVLVVWKGESQFDLIAVIQCVLETAGKRKHFSLGIRTLMMTFKGRVLITLMPLLNFEPSKGYEAVSSLFVLYLKENCPEGFGFPVPEEISVQASPFQSCFQVNLMTENPEVGPEAAAAEAVQMPRELSTLYRWVAPDVLGAPPILSQAYLDELKGTGVIFGGGELERWYRVEARASG
ncbi:hypothetical protein PIB30_018472 [Stylosanthes scabra]|uniref:Uncharacterized protein n=1 Tax=Stylosanthes scabra TaxID=79078 RepID=A0ABU6V7B6_9FABA|nr:hypothetical protein [Stylosanthes scabra]